MTTTFHAVDSEGTTFSEDPKRDAYRYMAYVQHVLRRPTQLTVEGGRFRVEAPGLMTLTFVAEGQ